jgi:hypothetical protein
MKTASVILQVLVIRLTTKNISSNLNRVRKRYQRILKLDAYSVIPLALDK